MLAQLFLGSVFQPGLELRQHPVHGQLLGHLHAFVAQRDIGCFADLDAQRNANNLRAHFVQRIGLGVNGRQPGRVDLVQPAVELLFGQDGGVDHIALLGSHCHFRAGRIIQIKHITLSRSRLGGS